MGGVSHPLSTLVARHLAGVAPYRRAPSRASTLARIRLDANECAFPLPEGAVQQLKSAVASLDIARYPDSRCERLAELLAQRDGGQSDDYVFGAGSDEVITLLMRCFSEPRGNEKRARVLYLDPSFTMYRISAQANDLECVSVPLNERFQLDMPSLLEAIDATYPNLIFVASPNNPTGACFREDDLTTLAESSGGALLVLDAAYEAFGAGHLNRYADDFSHVAVLGTVSKLGFAGLRLGWCRMPSGLAEEFHRVRQPFNVSAVSQVLAELALTEFQELVDDRVKWVQQERTRVSKRLEGIPGCFPYPSDANFVLFRVSCNPERLATKLLEDGIAIKNLDPMGGALHQHLRVTLGTPEENEAFLQSLESQLSLV